MSTGKQPGRAAILGAIRGSLGRAELPEAERAAIDARLADPRRNLIPARAAIDHAAQVELFLDYLGMASGTFTRVASEADAPKALSEYLNSQNLPQRVAMAPDPWLDGLPWEKGAPLLERRSGRAQPDDEVGVTGALAGIAETGTLMLVSGPESPSTLTMLPETHVVVLRASQVIGAMEDGWDALRKHEGKGNMPRTAIFITGPSRTGDIEMKMYLGAHGPRRLHVIMIDNHGVIDDI